MNLVILGDNADVLTAWPSVIPEKSVRLIYIDPPFGLGKTQKRDRIKVTASEEGERTGFGAKRYDVEHVASGSYEDSSEDFERLLMGRIEASLRCLTPDGSLFVHLNPVNAHYIKVALDRLLGRDRFMNEIIWAYDYGGRPKNRWPAKHDTIFWYAMNPEDYVFNYDQIDRIPYLAPSLVGDEKAARGKTPTDVFWHTIVPTNGKEKTNYPTQKPFGVLNRIVRVHSDPGDVVLDFFAGSGTTGAAALANGRKFVLVDSNTEAFEVMKKRFGESEDITYTVAG